MAFTAGKSKEIEGKSNDWLLDQSLMQSMQDRFCDANNVYMVCLNAQNGVVTKAYGTKEELDSMNELEQGSVYINLIDMKSEGSYTVPLEIVLPNGVQLDHEVTIGVTLEKE